MKESFQKLFQQLLKDIKIELDDEFDRNFERKAFFTTAWKAEKHSTIGTLLMRTGALRKSLQSTIIGNSAIRWQSSLPYANIHNEGGKITVTQKMKGFFWYRYKLASAGVHNIKTKKKVNNALNKQRNTEAEFWKAMALKKVGSEIVIPQRQFIGEHQVVHQNIKTVADEWFNTDVKQYLDRELNNMVK